MTSSPAGTRKGRRVRLAVLTNELAPYRQPVFAFLARQPDIELVALVNSHAEAYRQWDGPDETAGDFIRQVPGWSIFWRQKHLQRMVYIPYGTWGALRRAAPDVVLSGEFGARTLLSWMYCAVTRTPLIIWNEDTPLGGIYTNGLQNWLRRFLVRRAAGFVAWSAPAERYLLSIGAEQHRISRAVQAVDNEYWQSAAAKTDQQAARRTLGLSQDGKIALCVGNLFTRKGVDLLIRAWAGLDPELQASHRLVLAGGGDQGAALEELAQELHANGIVFAGSIAYEAVAPYYMACDFLVLPTRLDVWGLVVNEALACGRPVLGSVYAASTEELLTGPQFGEHIDPEDTASLADALARWLAAPRRAPDAELQAHVSAWSPERAAEGILTAVGRAISND